VNGAQRAGDGVLGDQPAQLVGRHGGQQEVLYAEVIGNLAVAEPGGEGQRPGDSGVDAHGRQVSAERALLAA
jgi:hypothetical protein